MKQQKVKLPESALRRASYSDSFDFIMSNCLSHLKFHIGTKQVGIFMRGICIGCGQSLSLKTGKSYYLFPNGSNHYYVSNFNNKQSHMGCFQAIYFQVIKKDEWPPEPTAKLVSLDPEKVYLANLIWRKPGYQFLELKDYYIRLSKTHVDFFKDRNLSQYCGCFPVNWFSDFREIETKTADIEPILEENVPICTESEPKITKYEQLSLFDF